MTRADGRRSRRGCCVGCAGALLGSALLLFAVLCWANRPPDDVVIPTPPMPPVNGYDEVARAAAMLKGRAHLFPPSRPELPPATFTSGYLAAAYREAAPTFSALRIALRKPYQRAPDRAGSKWAEGNKEIREMARTLAGAAEYRASVGHFGEAADLVLDCEELGAVVPRGGGVIPEMVGVAVETIGICRAEAPLPHLTAGELAHAAKRLDRIVARRARYSDTLLEDGRSSASRWRAQFAQLNIGSPRAYYGSLRDMTTDPFAMVMGTVPPYPSAAQAGSMAQIAFTSKRAMVRGRLEFFERASRDVAGAYTGHLRSAVPTDPTLVPDVPMIEHVWGMHVAGRAALDILRVEVALLRYRRDHRRFPAQLANLTPRYLPSVPDDVCAGRPSIPLRYAVRNGGKSYTLYSVGPDMRDDGGQPAKYLSAPGDIVAGHLNGR